MLLRRRAETSAATTEPRLKARLAVAPAARASPDHGGITDNKISTVSSNTADGLHGELAVR
jgi:hypothetical protein